MSNEKTQAVTVQTKRTVADLINSEKMRGEIAKVLPKHLTPERMTRVALTAAMRNPLLMQCTPESLSDSLLRCSQAGLEPDGRLAHLIPYWNSKKSVYECQVIFDYKGLVTLALRNGAESVYADKVCEFDEFSASVENGDKKITHRPNWKAARGTVVAFYAVCKRGGEVDYEVMTVDEVESIRKRSRAGNSGPWVTDFDEMGKKCPLRRMSKRWDLLPEIRDLINADDDTPPPFSNQSVVSSPLFAPKVLPQAAPEPEQAAEAPQPDAPPEGYNPDDGPDMQPVPEHKAPASNGANYVKGVRSLCAAGRIKEGEVLDFLQREGVTDGSVVGLDFLPEPTLKSLYDNWSTNQAGGGPGISTQIIAARKAGAK